MKKLITITLMVWLSACGGNVSTDSRSDEMTAGKAPVLQAPVMDESGYPPPPPAPPVTMLPVQGTGGQSGATIIAAGCTSVSATTGGQAMDASTGGSAPTTVTGGMSTISSTGGSDPTASGWQPKAPGTPAGPPPPPSGPPAGSMAPAGSAGRFSVSMDAGVDGNVGTGGSGGASGSAGLVAGSAGTPSTGGSSSNGGSAGSGGQEIAASHLRVTLSPNTPPGKVVTVAEAAQSVYPISIQMTAVGGDVDLTGFSFRWSGTTLSPVTSALINDGVGWYLFDLAVDNASKFINVTPAGTGHRTIEDGRTLTIDLYVKFDVKDEGTVTFNVENPAAVTSDAVVDMSYPLTGNTFIFTTKSVDCANGPVLMADLASDPVSTTYVKKQKDVPLVGITFTAPCGSIHLAQVTVGGQVRNRSTDCSIFGGACAQPIFDQRVTSLGLYQEDVLIGQKKTFSQGRAVFSPGLDIAEGSSITLVAKATLGSTVGSVNEPDQVSVGINSNDVVAWDSDLNFVPIVFGEALQSQLGTTPRLTHQIRNSGTVSITSGIQAPERAVVAGSNVWQLYGTHFVTAQYEAMKMDRIAITARAGTGYVMHDGDFREVAIVQNGNVMGSTVYAPGNVSTDIDLSANPVVIPKDSKVGIDIWVKTDSVASSSTATEKSARSGDAPVICLSRGNTAGEWTAAYDASTNARVTGTVSGEYAYSSDPTSCSYPHELRKCFPVVTKLTPSSLTLTSGSPAELYKFQMTPDASCASQGFSWKQLVFHVSTFVSTGNVSLSHFELFKGSQRLWTTAGSEEVYIRRSWDGADITENTAISSDDVIVRLAYEEIVSSSGTVYTFRAIPTITGTGVSVSTSPLKIPSPMNGANGSVTLTGVLTESKAVDGFTGSLAIDGVNPYGVRVIGAAPFLWSDLAEIPHSAVLGSDGGSRDWTNSTNFSDLTQAQALTQ